MSINEMKIILPGPRLLPPLLDGPVQPGDGGGDEADGRGPGVAPHHGVGLAQPGVAEREQTAVRAVHHRGY